MILTNWNLFTNEQAEKRYGKEEWSNKVSLAESSPNLAKLEKLEIDKSYALFRNGCKPIWEESCAVGRFKCLAKVPPNVLRKFVKSPLFLNEAVIGIHITKKNVHLWVSQRSGHEMDLMLLEFTFICEKEVYYFHWHLFERRHPVEFPFLNIFFQSTNREIYGGRILKEMNYPCMQFSKLDSSFVIQCGFVTSLEGYCVEVRLPQVTKDAVLKLYDRVLWALLERQRPGSAPVLQAFYAASVDCEAEEGKLCLYANPTLVRQIMDKRSADADAMLEQLILFAAWWRRQLSPALLLFGDLVPFRVVSGSGVDV